MLQGIYTAASGMMAHDAISDVIANNLANVSTPGFRQDFATFNFDAENMKEVAPGVLTPTLVFKAFTKYDLGSLRQTDNPLDVAFSDSGDNFFAIQAPQGLRFTRAGNFILDENHVLTTTDKFPVLGANGPITLNGKDITITENGDVLSDGQFVDRLRAIRFDRINGRIPLQKDGYGLLEPISQNSIPRNAEKPQMRQGYLEGSNVNVMYEMARMIDITRGYEAYQRAIQVSDATLNTLIHRIGGIG
jgi:flagellar basal-body rod protein FlgG